MSKCKWCEKEFKIEHSDCSYCNFDCQRMFEKYNMRKSLFIFAEAMENEMQRKDAQSYTIKDKSTEFLIDKLFEERNEVDECFIEVNNKKQYINKFISKLVDEELLHEGIMLALVRKRLIEESSKEYIFLKSSKNKIFLKSSIEV